MNINNLKILEVNKLYERYKDKYKKLIFITKGYREKKIIDYDVLAYESAHTHNKLLNVIKIDINKANKAYGKVHLQTLMPKLKT